MRFFNHGRRGNFLPLLIVIFFGVLAARSLLFQDGYFNMHDDLQMMRQLELEKCILDGQIPCRWVPDMGYGFGFPLFNFYPPLPYMIAQVFRFMGASFVDTAKYAFALAFISSGITMYYLAKEFFGRIGGTLSSIFYVWAPYHSVDIYVRGAMNEAWALVWFPLILWSSYRLIIEDKKSNVMKWTVTLALSYASLLLTHNLMVLIFTPVMGVWIFLHLVKTKRWKKLSHLTFSGIWAVGLAAFFTLPAMLENKFTQIQGQLIGYYDYSAHFASIKQLLFSRFWGYGASVWLEEDDMSFQIGHIHWILSLFIGTILLYKLLRIIKEPKKAKISEAFLVTSFMLFVGWFAAFMTHPKSILIWKIFPQLRYVQFPWRFLTIVIFSFSFLIGYLPGMIAKWKEGKGFLVRFFVTKHELSWVFILVLVLVGINWNYFSPQGGKMGSLTDDQKFSGFAWDLQQTAGIYDYLPSTAVMAPRAPMSGLAEVLEGDATVTNQSAGTDWGEFMVNVDSDKATLRLGIFEFPGWEVYVCPSKREQSGVDGCEKVKKYIRDDEEWGRMYLDLTKGEHAIRAQFENTPIRKYSNIASVISFGGILVYAVNEKRKRL